MVDREKVLKGLECLITNETPCEGCPYNGSGYCMKNIAKDARELMKEQEAVEPYMDYDGQDVWRCGKCGNSLMHPSYYESDEDAKNHIRYCSHCGRAVKWE